VLDLPPTAQASISASIHDFVTADRGHIRRGNDGSDDSRCRHFAGWLTRQGFNQQSAATMNDGQILQVLGTYLHSLRYGDTIHQESKLMDQTLRRYLVSAAHCFTLLNGRRCLAHDPATMHQTQPALHPFLREQLRQRANWKKPKARIEPFTSLMFEHLYREIQSSRDPAKMFTSELAAVFDWTRLGLFTGSRLGEYGQSRLSRGVRFNVIPHSVDAGEWAGRSLAFIAEDFTFYDDAMHTVPCSTLSISHANARVTEVHIRFCYDKSKDNFIIRKFRSVDHLYLDPIDACVSIFRRAQYLRVPSAEPLGVFSTTPSSYRFIHATSVCRIMRQACCAAYPDPGHYLRTHINRIVAHSNRVTAAVCLKQGGADTDKIAFRLRWQPASVPTYLRECHQSIGVIMQQALLGAYRSTM
jgi:hypothetical protein